MRNSITCSLLSACHALDVFSKLIVTVIIIVIIIIEHDLKITMLCSFFLIINEVKSIWHRVIMAAFLPAR